MLLVTRVTFFADFVPFALLGNIQDKGRVAYTIPISILRSEKPEFSMVQWLEFRKNLEIPR